jgi:glutaminyl-tRNA synthetase
VVAHALVEPPVAAAPAGSRFQFEHLGYFAVDPDTSPAKPVFNRIVTLRDTWAKIAQSGQGDAKRAG